MGLEAVGSDATRCPRCAAVVQADWLTCRSCGSILAAVRGSATAAVPRERDMVTAMPPQGPEAAPSSPPEAPAAAGPPILSHVPVGPEFGADAPAPVVPGWPSPPPPPTEPPPPTTQAVHTAAIPPNATPATSRELGPNQWYSSRSGEPATAVASATTQEPPKAALLADIPVSLPQTTGGRVATVGLALVLIAAFLPWSPLLTGISYFDAWGFSRSSRLIVFALDLVLLLVAILPLGLSARIRTGWLPLVFGTFVVGVFWERVDSIAVVGIGAWLFALGGLLAAIGGLLTLISHGEPAAAAAEMGS